MLEQQTRKAPQTNPASQPRAQKSRCMVQRSRRRVAVRAAARRYEHPRVPQVPRDVDTRNRHLADSRVRQLSGDEDGQFAPDLIRNADRPAEFGVFSSSSVQRARVGSGRSFDLDAFVDLDLIPSLDVVVVTDSDAAFGTRADLVHVVLESA